MTILVLIAYIGGQRVAIDAASVECVVDLADITPVPLAPPHVLGLSAVRSRVLTVIDTARAIGLSGRDTSRRVLVMEAGGHSYALRVDEVEDVTLAETADSAADNVAGTCWAGVARGTLCTADGLALLIDPAMLMNAALADAA